MENISKNLSNNEKNKLSKKYLKIAFIELLNKKEPYSISITELVEKAGVARATFYRNYNSKEDIMKEIELDILKETKKIFNNTNDFSEPYDWYLYIFKRLKENDTIMKKLFKSKVEISYFFKEPTLFQRILSTKNNIFHYSLLAIEGALLYITKDWIENDCQTSPEDMAKICCEVIPGNPLEIIK